MKTCTQNANGSVTVTETFPEATNTLTREKYIPVRTWTIPADQIAQHIADPEHAEAIRIERAKNPAAFDAKVNRALAPRDAKPDAIPDKAAEIFADFEARA